MENIEIRTCCECNCELRQSEYYYGVCDSCRKMITEYNKEMEEAE